MIATVTNFGNNLGIQFPESFLNNMQISENDDVEIFVMNNNIVIKRPENPKHLTTKERIAAFFETGDDIQVSEIEWGKPQGKEILCP